MSRFAAYALLLIAAAIWGGGFVALSQAMRVIGPGWFTGLSFALAFLVVAPFGYLESRRSPQRLTGRDFVLLVPLGVTFFGAAILQQVAVQLTTVTDVGFLTGLYVIFVPLFDLLLSKRFPHSSIWLSALLAIAGTGFLSHRLGGLRFGDVVTIASAVCFAAQIVIMDRFVRRTARPVAAALFQSLCCVILGCVLGLTTTSFSGSAIFAALPELLYAGLLCGGVAFALLAVCQKYIPASDTAIILNSEALFSACFAYFVLQERLSVNGWIGCLFVFFALVVAQIGPHLNRYIQRGLGRHLKRPTRV